ncbi:DUF2637 domain-containing protein [Streptomyces sp. SB3404]|uniref:DUF2637 domain-containing protein n=1 Tax=Streptomyces boncukensis TaxID=2711219 RepID=A0A6G4WQC7_9ACTN|nr:DUF2637 domain-containing protein [Streptomyces boncukensis]NGO67466.1 DUF2637 domain-containing protein [Streptomyces boncukensis]
MSLGQVRASERTLAAGTWAITAGAVLFSVLTVTPLVVRVTPPGWAWTAPLLPLVVDTAVVIVVRLDAVLARLGGDGGRWPAVLRWMTGLMTLFLNIGDSALKGDPVGVAVHAVAPLLLIVTAEAGRAYRQALAHAVERQERSRAQQQEARERRAREERERERQAREREQRAAREHAEQMERERFEREAAVRREEREHAYRVRCEELAREDRRREEEREREERERRQRAERAEAARKAREQPRAPAVNAGKGAVKGREQRAVNGAPSASRKLAEDEARAFIGDPANADRSVRQLAEATGWSVGWVSARLQQLRDQDTADAPGTDGAIAPDSAAQGVRA